MKVTRNFMLEPNLKRVFTYLILITYRTPVSPSRELHNICICVFLVFYLIVGLEICYDQQLLFLYTAVTLQFLCTEKNYLTYISRTVDFRGSL